MYYTVYKIINLINNKIYIGVHKTQDINDDYMGSGKYLGYAQEKYGIKNFRKEILEIYNNSEDMLLKEAELVNESFVKRKDTYNVALGGFGWGISSETKKKLKDTVTVKDKNGNFSKVSINDKRYLSGELVHHLKDMVTVKDKSGNKFNVSINDKRYLSGELVGINKGKKTSKKTKKILSNKKIGKVPCRDLRDGERKIINKDLFNENKFNGKDGYYVGSASKIKNF